MTLTSLARLKAPPGLVVMGATDLDDRTSVVLLGAGRDLWPVFTATAEYADGERDPLDRWSKRVIGALAAKLNARAAYPSDGPPYLPFISWALQTGRFFQSPTGMMIHDEAGLMISIRGALLFDVPIRLEQVSQASPCDRCTDKPCVSACPVAALSATHAYDVPKCKAFLDTVDGADCMSQGCRVRRACPVSQEFGRLPIQSAFHMRAFHPQ
ncbi:ferredoxin [Roseobacter sinensis]|uniref:Ferredoxin n=1 Tax=Roseobacter sinensis TaxID=2931391 RepID=A0ABT3BJH2_9RHOB|nr:ferredoxin [Roseobacter sp. WL0113]MCV3273711.1 ferredoxin [Roseobacter sp. WL0113]